MHRFWSGFLLLTLLHAPVHASSEIDLQLVKDITTAPAPGRSAPAHFRVNGGALYFNATTPLLGRELYVSDGVDAQLVADLAPGTASSNATLLGRVSGGRLIVDADDGVQGQQVAVFDPLGATLTPLMPFGVPSSGPRTEPVAQIGAHVLFRTLTDGRVWTTDGTQAGTVEMTGVISGWNLASRFCSLPGGLALFATTSGGNVRLWRSDGSATGTAVIADLAQDQSFVAAASSAGRCHFLLGRSGGWSLWRSDGVNTTPVGLQGGATPLTLAANATRVFVSDRTATQSRIWRSDSSQPLASYALGDGGIQALSTVGDRLVYAVPVIQSGGATRDAIYASDGATPGTLLPTPAVFPSSLSTLRHYRAGNALVVGSYYYAWRIDPYAGSITTLDRGFMMFDAGDAVEFGGAVVGRGASGDIDDEVWRTDGTPAGTQRLHAIWPANSGTFLVRDYVASHGDALFFTVVDYDNGWQSPASLWRSDGSEAGTRPLSRSLYGDGTVFALARYGDGVLFHSRTIPEGGYYRADRELATASRVLDSNDSTLIGSRDGSVALASCSITLYDRDLCALRADGTQAALVLPDGEYGRQAVPVGSLGGAVLVFLADGPGGLDRRGLWRSDGTAPGTVRLVPDLERSGDIGTVRPPASLIDGARLWFDACRPGGIDCALYRTDGSSAGTQRIAALPAPVYAFARLADGRVAFVTGFLHNAQLWVSDGTATGTQMLRTFTGDQVPAFAGIGGRAHFIVSQQDGNAYYVSDGSDTGTAPVALAPGMTIYSFFIVPLDANTAAFSCRTGTTGGEFCAIDADGANVRVVRDIFPGPEASRIEPMGATDGAVYFVADDGYRGSELWRAVTRGDAVFADGFD